MQVTEKACLNLANKGKIVGLKKLKEKAEK
jgi:hypothetical protein